MDKVNLQEKLGLFTELWSPRIVAELNRPVVETEAHVLLLEPATILNTGNVRSDRTVESSRRL